MVPILSSAVLAGAGVVLAGSSLVAPVRLLGHPAKEVRTEAVLGVNAPGVAAPVKDTGATTPDAITADEVVDCEKLWQEYFACLMKNPECPLVPPDCRE
jgi:hypothetical protein